MESHALLGRARRAAGLSQAALADKAGTSRTALSAYERGRKSPTLETAARIVRAVGFALDIRPVIEFHEAGTYRGRPIMVPTALPRLPLERAFAVVELPLHVNWSEVGRRYDLGDRRERALVYERVVRDGLPDDVLTFIDGALLVDVWDTLVVPAPIREAWGALVVDDVAQAVA